MARAWKARPSPAQTSVTEIARRYHACAVALAKTLGLSVPEVLAQHRESVTAIFIESGRCELRLPAGVALPPLGTPIPVASPNGPLSSENSGDGQVEPSRAEHQPLNGAGRLEPEADVPDFPPPTGEAPLPAAIPEGLPCAGKAIAGLRPAQLAMVLSKTDALAAAEGRAWAPLLEALTAERQRRLARGAKGHTPAVVDGAGHGR